MADIAIFIASSRTGLELIEQGLNRSLSIRAAVRSPSKLKSLLPPTTISNPKLSIHPCDTNSVSSVQSIISSVKTIFIACGGNVLTEPAYMNQDLTTTIIAAISLLEPAKRPSRIVLLSAEYCHPEFKQENPWAYFILGQHILHSVNVDLTRTQAILEKNKDLVSFTFFQPGGIVSTPKLKVDGSSDGGKIILTDKHDGSMLSYANVANAMLNMGMDEECKNGMRGATAEVAPRPGWEGLATQRELMMTVVMEYVLKPATRIGFWVAVGYLLKSRVMGRRTFDVLGFKF